MLHSGFLKKKVYIENSLPRINLLLPVHILRTFTFRNVSINFVVARETNRANNEETFFCFVEGLRLYNSFCLLEGDMHGNNLWFLWHSHVCFQIYFPMISNGLSRHR